MRLFKYILLLLILFPSLSFAQQDSTGTRVQDDIEQALDLFDLTENEANAEQLVQHLQEWAVNPVNINEAGVNELRQLPGINLKSARAIIDFRTDEKPFEDINELDNVPGIGKVTVEKVRPYITVGSGFGLRKMLYSDPGYWADGGKAQLFSRYQQNLQQAQGYTMTPEEGGYIGSPVKYYQRTGYRSRHLSLNLTQEKDPGEELPGITRFDHSSGHLALKDNGRLTMVVAGDYGLSFGQGLVLWNGAAFGKGGDVIGGPNRNGSGIKPYTSAQETNYLRGFAATYGQKLQATAFYSRRPHSATTVSDGSMRYPNASGYHRTVREWERRHNISQTVYGGRLQAEFPIGLVGITGYRTIFDHKIEPPDQLYARYNFQGRTNYVGGLDYSLVVGPAVVYGEAARSRNGGFGAITGLEALLESGTDLSLSYRNYQKDFQSTMGNGFAEVAGTPKNEEGIYLGLRQSLGKKVVLSAYMDQFRFPFARFGTTQPTKGHEWLTKIEFNPHKNLEIYVHARGQVKEDEYKSVDEYGRTIRRLGEEHRSSFRANLQYWTNPYVRLRTRGEMVQSRLPADDEQAERGYLLYQDLRLVLQQNLKLDMRLTMFDTDSYATRVYQFENDLLYVFASKMLYKRGQRAYLLLNYEPFDFFELWAKIGITIYEGEQIVGSGLNQIEGDSRSDIGIQIRLQF